MVSLWALLITYDQQELNHKLTDDLLYMQGYVEIHKLRPLTVYQLVMWCSNSVGVSPVTQVFFTTPGTKRGNITLQSS